MNVMIISDQSFVAEVRDSSLVFVQIQKGWKIIVKIGGRTVTSYVQLRASWQAHLFLS